PASRANATLQPGPTGGPDHEAGQHDHADDGHPRHAPSPSPFGMVRSDGPIGRLLILCPVLHQQPLLAIPPPSPVGRELRLGAHGSILLGGAVVGRVSLEPVTSQSRTFDTRSGWVTRVCDQL